MLMLVIVFLLVLLSTLGLAYRQMVQTLRLEEARTRQLDLDQNGSLRLAVFGLGMLEGEMTVTTYERTEPYTTLSGQKFYKLVMERDPHVDANGVETWRLTVTPITP
jgi:hypothetical protein